MKKKNKSWIGFLLTILLISVAAAGCGKKEKEEETETTETATASSESIEVDGTYYSESEDAEYEFKDGTVKVTASNGASAEGTYDAADGMMTIILGNNILTYSFKETDTGFELSSQGNTYVYTKK